jgi:hypothetical protein
MGTSLLVVIITTEKVHDVSILDQVPLIIELRAIYIKDRSYLDFARLYKIHGHRHFFHLDKNKLPPKISLLPTY